MFGLDRSILWIVLGLFWIRSSGAPVTTEVAEEESRKYANKCAPDPYCPGDNFPNKIIFGDHFIQCDNVPQPRNSCCLPQEKHLVCFNILVDGNFLNFDQSNPGKTTDFYGLCQAIVKSMGKEAGNYAKVTLDTKQGGYMRYNYEEFADIDEPSKRSIKDLACGIDGEWPGMPKVRTTTTTTTTTTPKVVVKEPKVIPQRQVQYN